MTKKTNRKKVEATKEVNREEAQAAFIAYSEANSQQDKIIAEMELAMNTIRETKGPRLLELEKVKEGHFALLQAYANANKPAEGVKKSIEFTCGKIGFRTGTPALKTLSGFTWDSVTALLKKHRVLKAYLKTSVTPMKDKLLADRELPKYAKYFEKVGIKVEQKETFYVEPKTEEVEAAA
jgi:phage host-nuclease inhibitor protein Gam